jgi:hypothetical protein
MMNHQEREQALQLMTRTSEHFYASARLVGVHPFIEFTGLMNEYIKICRDAHAHGIDFTECNAHSGQKLPLRHQHLDYLNEKLECIYGGRVVIEQCGVTTGGEQD